MKMAWQMVGIEMPPTPMRVCKSMNQLSGGVLGSGWVEIERRESRVTPGYTLVRYKADWPTRALPSSASAPRHFLGVLKKKHTHTHSNTRNNTAQQRVKSIAVV